MHDVLEVSSNHFSMNVVIVQNEHHPISRGMPLGNRKASVLDEQARFPKSITSIYDLRR
jgi:hypothetical protein